MNNKISLGIVTCQRPHFFKECMVSIPFDDVDFCKIVVVNDGKDCVKHLIPSDRNIEYIHNVSNLGVGKSKNILLKKLLDSGAEHIFLIEDDCKILDKNVFEKYIQASKVSNILHLSYGPGSPLNLVQNESQSIYDRDKLSTDLVPNRRLSVGYGLADPMITFYLNAVGMFNYYHCSVLEKVGYMDETFYNAWEHVEHTYRIIQEGFHPPFWYFADIYDSEKYLAPVSDNHIKESVIGKDKVKWSKHVQNGFEYFKKKHGISILEIPHASQEEVIDWLKRHKQINYTTYIYEIR